MKPLISRLWIQLHFVAAGSLTFAAQAAPHFEAKHEDQSWEARVVAARSKEAGRILYFLPARGLPLAVINQGLRDGLEEGALLRSQRPPTPGGGEGAIITGTLKVRRLDAHQAIAEVMEEGTSLAASVFPEHGRVMAGDLVAKPRLLVSKRLQVLPERSLLYKDLFADPQAAPLSFELSASGRQQLLAAGAEFAGKRFSLLFVKGFTDEAGQAEANQVESYERALTVRQFLISAMGFQAEKVVALGFGETSLADRSQLEEAASRNRRIVLEVVPEKADTAKTP